MSEDRDMAADDMLETQDGLNESGDIREDEQPEPPPERNTEAMSVLEAAIFASNEMLTAARLKAILPGEPDGRAIRRMVRTVNEKLQHERHPFEIVEIGGGYQFRTVPYYHPWVQQVFKERAARRLSIQALECLAITAYKQPLTKAEIETIRGVTSDGALKTLLEKRLVTIAGRSDKPGHPLLYGTTPFFLQYFGLNKLGDLPKIEEFEAMAREKMDDLSEEEMQQIEELADPEGSDTPDEASGSDGDTPGEHESTDTATDAPQDTADDTDSTVEAPTADTEKEKSMDFDDDTREDVAEESLSSLEALDEGDDSSTDDADDVMTELAEEGANVEFPDADDDDSEVAAELPSETGGTALSDDDADVDTDVDSDDDDETDD